MSQSIAKCGPSCSAREGVRECVCVCAHKRYITTQLMVTHTLLPPLCLPASYHDLLGLLLLGGQSHVQHILPPRGLLHSQLQLGLRLLQLGHLIRPSGLQEGEEVVDVCILLLPSERRRGVRKRRREGGKKSKEKEYVVFSTTINISNSHFDTILSLLSSLMSLELSFTCNTRRGQR